MWMRTYSFILCIGIIFNILVESYSQQNESIKISYEDACRGDDFGVNGEFDFFVLQQSWTGEFCKEKYYPGCKRPTAHMQKSLTLHGIWPTYTDPIQNHYWPQCCTCSEGPTLNSSAISELLVQLREHWPDEQAASWPNYIHSDLWEHEWGKHGTCSGLDQYDYFYTSLVLDQLLPTPPSISSNIGSSVQLSKLLEYYGKISNPCPEGEDCIVGIRCKNGYLSDVTTCWSKQNLKQIICPYHAIKNFYCPHTVNIRAFSST